MVITALAENTSVNSDLGCQHGLSMYIETQQHKILFDMGVDELFAKNALILDIDLRQVDIAFISHAHYDHGGGLKTFLQLNDKSNVYLSSKIFEHYVANVPNGARKYIGLDNALAICDRYTFVGRHLQIDDELSLFSDVKCEKMNPTGNADILKRVGDSYIPDDFQHEQNLIIRENGKTVLVSGCSHCGIVNILEHFHRENGCYPDTVVGGFHLFNPSRNESETPEFVRDIGDFLIKTKSKFYTCHCTGLESYNLLKIAMGDAIDYLSGGMTLEI